MPLQRPNDLENAGDTVLVERSLLGDQNAYGQIVERYQSLVCSVAYSRCGDLSLSEDLAQDAFLRAWKKLAELKEAAHFKSWICTIVRNMASRATHNQQRSITRHAVRLESASTIEMETPSPVERAASAEEEALVWKALDAIPESYREPMVLFYREDESVARVAVALNLSEDAVKQRLARGRRMLQQNMAATVEATLSKSRPSKAFTASVLAGMSGLVSKPATAAGVSTAATTAAKTSFGGLAKAATTVGAGMAASFGLVFVSLLAQIPVIRWMRKQSDASLEELSDDERQMVDEMSFRKPYGNLIRSTVFLGGLFTTTWLMKNMDSKWEGYTIFTFLYFVWRVPSLLADRRISNRMMQSRIDAGTYIAPGPLTGNVNDRVALKTVELIVLRGYLIIVWPTIIAVFGGDWTAAVGLLATSTVIGVVASLFALRIPTLSSLICKLSYCATSLLGMAAMLWRREDWTPGIGYFGLYFSAMIGMSMTMLVLSMQITKRMQQQSPQNDDGNERR